MAKKRKTPLSSERKTELAKTIAQKGQTFARTYASIEIKISKCFRWISGWLDKLLFNQQHGKFVALILAILFYITLNVNGDAIFENITNAETLGDFEVTPLISDEAYEVSGLPETVEVTLKGDISDIKNVKQQKSLRIIANMTDLTEGTHEVKLTTESAPSSVDVLIQPSNALVTIKKKSIRSFSLGYDYVNRFKMDSVYDLGEPKLEQGEVYVRASTDTLDEIAYVKALINVQEDYSSDFETQAEIAAYNALGEKMEVDIIPSTMKATVAVTKPSKRVPVTLVPNGVIPNNKAIESYTMNHDKVSVYAKQSVLDTIEELPISIPASTLTSDREISMPLILPNGVTKLSETMTNISIKLAEKKDKDIQDVNVSFTNVAEGFIVDFENEKDKKVTVTAYGAQKVLDEIKNDQLQVYVDMSKVDKSGTYEMPLLVEGKNKLATYELKNATITVVVSEK